MMYLKKQVHVHIDISITYVIWYIIDWLFGTHEILTCLVDNATVQTSDYIGVYHWSVF